MSLDYGMIARFLVESFSKKERFQDDNLQQNNKIDSGIDMYNVLYVALSITLGVVAFSLSWNCNTAMGYSTVVKAVFGTLSFLFGMSYILLYFVMRWDTCARISKRRR
jgi:hypothetical protein